MENILLLMVVVLSTVVVLQSVVIGVLVANRKKFAAKIKQKYDVIKVENRNMNYRKKIADLYGEIDSLQRSFNKCNEDKIEYKIKANDYAYAMDKITKLYQVACGTISSYIQSGLLIKDFSENRHAYEDFVNIWRGLQDRQYVRVYKLNQIIDNPKDLEYLFGTSDRGFLSEVFK